MSTQSLTFSKLNHHFFLKARELSITDPTQAKMLLNMSSEEVERLGNLDIEDLGLVAEIDAPLISVNTKRTDVMLKLIDALERQDDNALRVITQKMTIK